MKPNLIDERDKRTIHRKLAKENYDNIITLSTDRTKTVRLLDEGAVVMANGVIDFYIQKGTLRKYMDSLPDDYVGSINLGHNTFSSFPILIGQWKKEDLHLVDIGDGREGLDVDLKLDYENPLVQAITYAADKYDYSLGVSSEFSYSVNEEASREWGVMIIDELFIGDFAIVGEAGNVNSSNIQLKGDTKVTLKELSEKLDKGLDKVSEIKDVNDALDKLLEVSSEEAVEETVEEQVEETVEEVEETEEPVEETVEETEEQEEEISLAAIYEAVQNLTSRLDEVTAERDQLREALKAKEEEEQAFVDKFKNLSVKLSEERTTPTTKAKVYTDGIGD